MGELTPRDVADLKVRPSWRVAIVTARFNNHVTDRLEQVARTRLTELGFNDEQVLSLRVPGAVEVPLAARWLLEKGYDAIVALGAVIRGDTDHYDYVCRSVERGCTQLQLEFSRPVTFGVLTTDNREQAMARAGGSKGNKGVEAVDVMVEMLNLKWQLEV